MGPDHGMVKFGGRFARTTRALTAIWLGDGHWAAAAPGIQRLCSPRGSTFHVLSVGENGGERTGLRSRGGRDQGSHRAGAAMDRRNGVGSKLALPLAARWRGGYNRVGCGRRVGPE